MDVQKPKPKLASIRTYAEDLAITKERRNTPIEKGEVTTDLTNKTVPEPSVSVVPPKTFTRSKNTTPIETKKAVVQGALNDLVKTEIKTPAKVSVPSGIETPIASFLAENEDSAAATIITDTKKDRFKLFPSIIESISNWFSEKKKEQALKKAPRYTVAETSRRKGVIQKATSNTGKAASADFASIQERIRQRKLAEKSTPTTTWSANTETGFLLLEAPEPEVEKAPVVQNVQLVPKKSARANDVTPKTLSRVTANIIEIPEGPSGFEDPTYLAKNVLTQAEPEVTLTDEEDYTETLPTAEEPVVAYEETQEEIETVDTPVDNTELELAGDTQTPSTLSTEQSKNLLLRFNTNSIAIIISGVAIGVFVLGFVLYQVLTPRVATLIPEKQIQAFPDSELAEVNLGELSTADLAAKILPLREESTRVTEVAIKVNGSELDPAVAAQIIADNVQPDFAHSLTLTRPGFSGEQIPFVVLGITDATIARGGMLFWENNLYRDFNNTFGTNLPIPTSPKFIDGSLSGTDVRVLKNTAGEEILLYGIINNTIIITTDSMTFAALVPLITN